MNETKQPGGKEILVFVYGTLKAGFGNHGYFLKGKSEFVSYGKTKDKLKMYDTGGYPVVFNHKEKEAPVSGEIYAIDQAALSGLDRLEGNGSLFVRGIYDIELLDGSVLPCMMYCGVPAAWDRSIEHLSAIPANTLGEFNWRETSKHGDNRVAFVQPQKP